MKSNKSLLTLFAIGAAVLLATACTRSALKDELVRPPPSYSEPPATEGALAGIAQRIAAEHGPSASGFMALDDSKTALDWRIALIDSAVSSVDIQTYLWYPDNAGRFLLERAVNAAERGVQVRLVVDDLLTVGLDQAFAALQKHPNIEFRMFNPWKDRDLGARVGEMIAKMERLNTRMHDKLLVVDGVAVIMGGRNLGDHYFGLSNDFNFHDLDVIGFGPVAQQAAEMFDHFWNSEWVVSALNLASEPDPENEAEAWTNLLTKNREAAELAAFPRDHRDWGEALSQLEKQLRIGTSEVAYDEATAETISQKMGAAMFAFMERANRELLITNAYIIPGERGIDLVRRLTERGVKVKILTNSLASHDVPAVNSHYKDWRDDLVEAGAELYELRADAQIRSIVEVPPAQGEFVGLHTKAAVADRRHVLIGSMNLDPRSANINTEAGVFIDSPPLAEDVAALMERDMAPENAWQVLLDENGEPYWTNSDETVTTQPARSGTQRVMEVIFSAFPKELF